MKKNLPVTQRDTNYPDHFNILSTTDTKGKITYINSQFMEVSGFSADELLNQNHNVIRHPDMPPAAFEDLWQTVKRGKSWMGIVKNRCKNGDHYWVDAYVTPINEGGQITEYQSVRFKPTPERVQRAERVYPALLQGRLPAALTRPRLSFGHKLVLGISAGFLPLVAWTLWHQPTAGLLASLLVSLTMAFGIGHLLTGRLRNLATEASQKADNKLMQYIYTGTQDELGQIELAFKMLSSELRAVVARVQDSSEQVQAAADIAGTNVRNSAHSAELQNRELDQVATAVEEMSASIQEVALNIQETSQATANALQAALGGKSEVEKSFDSIHELLKEVDRASGLIQELEQHSSKIGTVLDVIKSIAEQTNLLALNAAIEAARAGEAGRGFAVVADEVRTLAQRTQDSTQEIESIIESLQQGVRESVGVMAQGQAISQRSVADIRRTSEVLESITDSMAAISDRSVQVASATEEQSAVSNEISSNLNRVSELAIETAQSSERAAQESSKLLDQASHQQGLINQFLKH